jgi:glycerol-3-phosphate acyltransferase PlsY
MLWPLIALVFGYVLGSVSFAVLVAKRHGVDILKAGSGNPGATNVKRVLGKGPGNVVFALDFLKGFVSAGWPLVALHFNLIHGGVLEKWVTSNSFLHFDWLPAQSPAIWMGIAGLAGAILGHSFSMFLRFKGGKGVATTIGGLMALMPLVIFGGLLGWVAVFFSTRYVSLASMVMGLSLMPLAALLGEPREKIGLCFVLAILIIVRHRANLKRLMDGTEHKFEKRKGPEATEATKATDGSDNSIR